MVAAPGSDLDVIEQGTVRGDTGGDEPATKAASRVERERIGTLAQPAMLAVEAAHQTTEAGVWRGHRQHVTSAPPEGVALQLERLFGIDPGMDEEHPAILGEGGALQSREQLAMAGTGIDRGAQGGGPARQCERPVP